MTKMVDGRAEDLTNISRKDILVAESDQVRVYRDTLSIGASSLQYRLFSSLTRGLSVPYNYGYTVNSI